MNINNSLPYFYDTSEPISNNSIGHQIELGTRSPIIGAYSPTINQFKSNFINIVTDTGADYTFAYTFFNQEWIVRRDNLTNTWTLVAYMYFGGKIGETQGFNNSTTNTMAWGTSILNTTNWNNLLQPDSYYTNVNTIKLFPDGKINN